MTQVAPKATPGWIWGLAFFGVLIWLIASCHPSTTPPAISHSTFEDPAFPYTAFSSPRTYGVLKTRKAPTVNLRSGPGTQYEVTGTLSGDDTIVALGTATGGSASNWLVLRTNDGHVAYANHSLLGRLDHVQMASSATPNATTQPASFHCTPTGTSVESLICQDAALAKSDRTMDEIYTPLLARLSGEQRSNLIAEQTQWVVERNQCASDANPKNCISQEYQTRILTLQLSAPAYSSSSSADSDTPE